MNPENQQRGYSKDPIPLADYGILVGALNAAIALTAAGSGKDGRLLPGAKPFDFLVLALATHKLARLISKDKVTSALRAPFSRLEGGAGAGELDEVERGHGMRRTIGELVTCPYCATPWAATALVLGHTLSRRAGKTYTLVLALTAAGHFLHQAYAKSKDWNHQT